MSKMITMIPLAGSIVVARPRDKDGKVAQMSPPANKPFAFTEDEVKDINRLSPGVLRKPSNEVTSVEDDDEVVEPDPALKAVATPAEPEPEPEEDPEPEPAPPPKAKGKAAKDDLGGL